MSRLTVVEQECQDVLVAVRDIWTMPNHQIGKYDFMELLGIIRTVLVHLQNKEYGCASGKHSGKCQCTSI